MRKNIKKNFVKSAVVICLSVWAFTASASTQLIGSVTDSCPSVVSNGYVVGTRFQASQSGTMNVFRIRTTYSGNIEAALYSDVGGTPTTLLASQTQTAVAGGYVDITFPDYSLTSGTYYWLAENSDATDPCYSSGGTSGYFSRTFGSGFPSTFPAYSSASWDMKLQGWASSSPATSTPAEISVDMSTSTITGYSLCYLTSTTSRCTYYGGVTYYDWLIFAMWVLFLLTIPFLHNLFTLYKKKKTY